MTLGNRYRIYYKSNIKNFNLYTYINKFIKNINLNFMNSILTLTAFD